MGIGAAVAVGVEGGDVGRPRAGMGWRGRRGRRLGRRGTGRGIGLGYAPRDEGMDSISGGGNAASGDFPGSMLADSGEE